MLRQRATPLIRVPTLLVVILAALLWTSALPMNAQESVAKPIAKKAVPSPTAQSKAEDLIRKLFAAKLKEAKTDKTAALALAAELFAQGKATKDDDTLQFVALKLASELAAAAGDNTAALEAVEILAKTFQVETLGLKSSLYAQVEKSLTDKEDARELAEALLGLIAEALQSDNFAVAAKLMSTAERAAAKSEKLALVARVEKRAKEVEDAKKAFETIAPLLDKAGQELAVGKYYCFAKGNYDKGLPLLAKSNDAALKALAQRDLAKPAEPRQQIDLADDWYKLAEDQQGLAQRQTFRRAYHWYQLAQPKLEGLTRVRVDRLVTALAKLFPTSSGLMRLVEIAVEVRTLTPGQGQVIAVATSADGKLILAGFQNNNNLRLFDATTGLLKKDLLGHSGGLQSVAISTDKKWGLSSGNDNTVRMWNLETGQEVRRFNGHTGLPYAVRFVPGGKQVLTGCSSGVIRLFDMDSGNLVKTLTGHTGLVYDLSLSKDGKRAISISYDNTARVWDLEKSVEIKRLPLGQNGIRVALSSDGKRAVTSTLGNVVQVWDVDTAKELRKLEHPGMVWSVVMSPDGRRLYTGGGGGKWGGGKTTPATKENSEIHVWDLNTGKELRQLQGHSNWVWGMAVSADGRVLVSGSFDGTVRLWGAK